MSEEDTDTTFSGSCLDYNIPVELSNDHPIIMASILLPVEIRKTSKGKWKIRKGNVSFKLLFLRGCFILQFFSFLHLI